MYELKIKGTAMLALGLESALGFVSVGVIATA